MQLDVQVLPKAQRIGGPPRNRAFRIETFEVAEQQHPEVAARRQTRPADSVGVELRALLLDEGIEAGLVEHAIQAFVERVACAARQLAAGDPHRRLPLVAAAPAHCHGHQCNPRDRSCRSLHRGVSPQAAGPGGHGFYSLRSGLIRQSNSCNDRSLHSSGSLHGSGDYPRRPPHGRLPYPTLPEAATAPPYTDQPTSA